MGDTVYLSLRDPAAPRASRGRRGRVSSTVVTLGIVSLLTDISSEAVAAVLPLYLTSAMGLTFVAYGFIDGLFQGAGALVRVAGGWASDRGDRPKWVAFAGYVLSALTRGGLVLAQGFTSVTALVTIDRIGKGIRTAPRDALITASSDPRSVARAFGVHRALDTVGAALGPLLAFVTLSVIPEGYTTVFVMSFGCAVVGVAVLGLLVPDRRPRRELAGPGAQPEPMRWRQFADPRLRRLLVAMGVLSLLTVGDGFLYLSLQDRDGFAAQWFPLLFVGTNIVYIALAIPLGRIADRFGGARTLVLGHVALAGAYVCAAVPAGGTALTVTCLALLGAFYAATDGVLSAVAGRLVEPAVRGSAIGAAQGVVALARMLASTSFGALWYALGRADAMLVVTVLLSLAVPACVLLTRGLDGHSEAL
ncbi:MFS transporter [Georgenia yuyongxinii]|uniref:MFS transporter n=1 Tax=Georgenia yuyongxinii TaxID=2589797 RepID=UPI001E4BDCE8|nr:MFS transporter [Georgenia yuyongxinii]